jgi:hypothetical protein
MKMKIFSLINLCWPHTVRQLLVKSTNTDSGKFKHFWIFKSIPLFQPLKQKCFPKKLHSATYRAHLQDEVYHTEDIKHVPMKCEHLIVSHLIVSQCGRIDDCKEETQNFETDDT